MASYGLESSGSLINNDIIIIKIKNMAMDDDSESLKFFSRHAIQAEKSSD